MRTKNLTWLLALLLWLAGGGTGWCFYNPSTGRWLNRDPIEENTGPNSYAIAVNDGLNHLDILGLLVAEVRSIDYIGHGSAEKNGTIRQYIQIDNAIQTPNGQVPLNVTAAKPAAFISARLDDRFHADIFAWTRLSNDAGITALQLSTELSGSVKVCCPCPFRKVRARWSLSAAIRGTAGIAEAAFANRRVKTAWNKPATFQSGTTDRDVDASYCATFSFAIGQGWTDVSKTTPTTSIVMSQASFECTE